MATLPELNDTSLTLDLFKDDSLRSGESSTNINPDYGNVARLEFLGARCFDLAVAKHIYDQQPLAGKDEMENSSRSVKSEENLKLWQTTYDLKNKIITTEISKQDEPAEIEKFFNRFVGALYFRQGHDVALEWVSHLIDPSQAGKSNAFPSGQNTHSRRSSASPSGITVAALNQKASQQGLIVTYPASRTGQDHLPTWTVCCCINGTQHGKGVGKNQRIAKEEAAREAWDAMKW